MAVLEATSPTQRLPFSSKDVLKELLLILQLLLYKNCWELFKEFSLLVQLLQNSDPELEVDSQLFDKVDDMTEQFTMPGGEHFVEGAAAAKRSW